LKKKPVGCKSAGLYDALCLSDSEITTIMAMARPLPPDARGAFLERVAARLAGQVLGDGLVARTCRELQREYLDPPGSSKYR
jgi:hypothetical protein